MMKIINVVIITAYLLPPLMANSAIIYHHSCGLQPPTCHPAIPVGAPNDDTTNYHAHSNHHHHYL